MKCPLCKVEMECRTPPAKKIYADFHCWNDQCPSTAINYRPHVGVVLAASSAPGRCISYHLPFKEWDGWYVLEGSEINNETNLYERSYFWMTDKVFEEKTEDREALATTVNDGLILWENELITNITPYMRTPINDNAHITFSKLCDTVKQIQIYEDYSYSYNAHSYYNNQNSNSQVPPATLGEMAEYFEGWCCD